MSFDVHTFTIIGVRPLLMHNGQLCDPMNEHTRALKSASSRRNKGDEDHADVARAEYVGGLYHDAKHGPYLPVDVLQACIESGAKKRKLGKIFKGCVMVNEPGWGGYALSYKGPREVEALISDPAFRLTKAARVGQARVMRTRPRFPVGWSCTFEVEIVRGAVTREQVTQAIADAGTYEGIGDWRPRYGRFTVEASK